jgi:hypothetical protein
MTLNSTLQVLAGVACRLYPGMLNEATDWFCTVLRRAHLKPPAAPKQYVATWGARMHAGVRTGSRSSLSGRLSKVSPQHAADAYAAALDWKAAGRSQPFTSYQDLAANCGVWRLVMEECGASSATVQRAVQRLHPRFGYHKLTPRRPVSRDKKDARLCAALAGQQFSKRELELTVFLDCKTTYAVGLQPQHGICDGSVDSSCPITRPVRHGGQPLRARLYGTVNALLGPLLLGFVTGTSGMEGGYGNLIYSVSHALNSDGCSRRAICCSACCNAAAHLASHARRVSPSLTCSHTTLKPSGCAASAKALSRSCRLSKLVSGLCGLVSSLLVCCWPCTSMSRPGGTSVIASQRWRCMCSVVPSGRVHAAAPLTLCVSTAYMPIDCSRSSKAYSTRSCVLPLPAHTRQANASLPRAAHCTPKKRQCFACSHEQ